MAKKEKALGLERCEAVLYPASAMSPNEPRGPSRALWAGLKSLDGNHYMVDHCEPIEQKSQRLDLLTEPTYDYADYTTISYAPVGPYIHHPTGARQPMQAPSFENIAYVPGKEDKVEKMGPDGCVVTRAAYLFGGEQRAGTLGGIPQQNQNAPHLYEMVTPKQASTRRHKTLDRAGRNTPIISAPTSAPTMRLPPLNSRYNTGGRYTMTAIANGGHHQHTLYPPIDRKTAHVSLDRSGATNTSLTSPQDNIYASPITSPVI